MRSEVKHPVTCSRSDLQGKCQAHWEESLRVLNLVRKGPDVEGWVSALTVPLFYFYRLRVVEEKRARTDVQAAVKGFRIVPLTSDIIDKALASRLPDFEDNIQLMSAETIAADYLVTRNKKHFQPSPVPIVTPEEWLTLDAVVQIEAKRPTGN